MKRKAPLLFISMLLFTLTPLQLLAESTPDLAAEARSAILLEFDTGTILYEKNGDEQLPPASITKVMTMLLVFEALAQGKVTYDDQVRTSEHAASMGGSQIFLEVGEEMSLRDLMKAVAIASANDAAVALAEHVAGTEEAFVQQMNAKVEALGLKNTHFVNPTGLPAENHYTSAYDIAVMSRELLKHQDVLQFTSIYEDYLRQDSKNPFWLVNTNRLVRFYEGVDGLKTGYTSEAKFCLTATAKKDEMRLIAVVLGAPSSKERNRSISSMLDYAFSQYQLHPLYEAGEPLAEVRIDRGKEERVIAMAPQRISLLLRKGEEVTEVEREIQLPEYLPAPITKASQLGQLELIHQGTRVGSYPLVAQADVREANYWDFLRRVSQQFLFQR